MFRLTLIALLFCAPTCAIGAIQPHHIVQELPQARASIDSTGFEGSVLVYSTSDGTSAAGHAERVDRRLIPASTFKIFNALVALETGVVSDPMTVIKWDGITRGRRELNVDLDLQKAFRISAVPHFQSLARSIGAERMQHFLDAVNYGNRSISGGIDKFWLSGGLRISAREQVDFLARMRQGELPFSPATVAAVMYMMVVETTPEYTVRGKTGWAILNAKENIGWWVGIVERESCAHVFATVLEGVAPGPTFGPARKTVTREVLDQLGVFFINHSCPQN